MARGRRWGTYVWMLVSLAGARPAAASEVGCPGRVVTPAAQATYYTPGTEGACSLAMAPGDLTTTVAPADFAGSETCGRCLHVTGPDGEVSVLVTDLCPECGAGHLDLSPAAFAAIADPLLGIVAVSWETVACDVGDDTMKLQFEGSNPWYLKVQVQEHRHGIATVDLRQGDQWLAMTRSEDDHFVRTGDGPYAEPFAFRIGDVHGQVVETDGVGLANDLPLDAGVQLAPCPEPAAAAGGCAALAGLAALHAGGRRSRAA